MTWFLAHKAPIGGILSAIGTILITNANPKVVVWGQLVLSLGTALVGGGVMKSDQYHKERLEDKKISEYLEKNVK